jgi:hypothetical protein
MAKTVTWKWPRRDHKIHEGVGKIWYALQNKRTRKYQQHT